MITPDKSSKKSKKNQVKDMFNNISSKYDRINQIMTLNMDKNWREIVYNLSMQDNPKKIIDIATGTGDIALCFANNDVEVIGVDNAQMMLDIAEKKGSNKQNITFLLEDAENMSFNDNTFDVATVGFGVRNFGDLDKGLKEIRR
ncbi:methyltransferase domain-containing protein, partial [bacterium]|nr:methyltransferase domain-containing protein [bacterium]